MGPSSPHTASVNSVERRSTNNRAKPDDDGYSPSEGARFASAELLRRAWFSLPLCDILRSVQVSVSSTVALRTSKVVAITIAHRTTDRTPLAGMGRIDLLGGDTSAFGLIRDELVKLVEMPRVDTRS